MTPEIDATLRRHLEEVFLGLNARAARQAFPAPFALADALTAVYKVSPNGLVRVPPRVPTLFATAAVEAWLRAIHSFLISTSITDASPLWSAISGYYASHYCMRAFAHLLGHFQMFRQKRIVALEKSRPMCLFSKKQAQDREHLFYWKVVKQDPFFASDPLFTNNPDDADVSDAANRNRTTYGDHLLNFPKFRVLDEDALKNRLQFISKIEFGAPPIPRRANAPDVESVQVVAYHRIVRFRRLLDEVLGGTSRFWTIQRTPTWASEWINFQLTDPPTLKSVPG